MFAFHPGFKPTDSILAFNPEEANVWSIRNLFPALLNQENSLVSSFLLRHASIQPRSCSLPKYSAQ